MMERNKVIEYALLECTGKIDIVDYPFFFNLFNQVYTAGADSKGVKITGRVRVYDLLGNSQLCDDAMTVKKKFGYKIKEVERHLRTGIPTKRGHVFRYE